MEAFEDGLILWGVGAAITVLGALALHILFFRALLGITKGRPVTAELAGRARWPARLIVATLAAYVTSFGAPLAVGVRNAIQHGLALALIAATGWLIIRVGFVLVDLALRRQEREIEERDNLRARQVRTQITVLRRVMAVVISILTVAAMLTTFAEARTVGASILASAGIIGVVAGIAAQPTLGSLISGIQIAFTEPIRLDDVVVVEGEWGRVEEITLSYVVVKLWDRRRLILPVSYFVQTPFQNWTRSTADLLGSVYLYVDYSVPVDEVRAELDRILEASDLWDGRTSVLQVTDATERGVQLRALMSAPDSPTAWELRCEVRERLLAHLQRHHPDSLPRVRAELQPGPSRDGEQDRRAEEDLVRSTRP